MAIDIKQLRPDNIFNILNSDKVSIETVDGKSYYKCQISEGDKTIKKIGYICPLMYIDYPFYLKFNNEANKKAFYVGKTGIYEIQFETIEDEEMNFDILEVWLPVDVDFIFDYEIIK